MKVYVFQQSYKKVLGESSQQKLTVKIDEKSNLLLQAIFPWPVTIWNMFAMLFSTLYMLQYLYNLFSAEGTYEVASCGDDGSVAVTRIVITSTSSTSLHVQQQKVYKEANAHSSCCTGL